MLGHSTYEPRIATSESSNKFWRICGKTCGSVHMRDYRTIITVNVRKNLRSIFVQTQHPQRSVMHWFFTCDGRVDTVSELKSSPLASNLPFACQFQRVPRTIDRIKQEYLSHPYPHYPWLIALAMHSWWTAPVHFSRWKYTTSTAAIDQYCTGLNKEAIREYLARFLLIILLPTATPYRTSHSITSLIELFILFHVFYFDCLRYLLNHYPSLFLGSFFAVFISASPRLFHFISSHFFCFTIWTFVNWMSN